MNFDPLYEVSQRTFSADSVRYFFFFAIGVYLLVDFWNQTLQYEGFSHASATFTLAAGLLAAVTSLIDTIESWNVRVTVGERLEALVIGVYSLLISWLGGLKMRDALRHESTVQNKAMPDSELYVLIGSFCALVVAVFIAVYFTS